MNCTRCLACATAASQAGLGRAGAAGAERGAAEVEHRQRDAQALAELAQDVLGRHGHVVERQPGRGGAADAALGHAGLDDLEAGHVGRHQEGGDLASRSLPGTGVRAITVSTSAMPPLVM